MDLKRVRKYRKGTTETMSSRAVENQCCCYCFSPEISYCYGQSRGCVQYWDECREITTPVLITLYIFMNPEGPQNPTAIDVHQGKCRQAGWKAPRTTSHFSHLSSGAADWRAPVISCRRVGHGRLRTAPGQREPRATGTGRPFHSASAILPVATAFSACTRADPRDGWFGPAHEERDGGCPQRLIGSALGLTLGSARLRTCFIFRISRHKLNSTEGPEMLLSEERTSVYQEQAGILKRGAAVNNGLTRKVLFLTLLKLGVPKSDIDGKPTAVLYALYKRKAGEHHPQLLSPPGPAVPAVKWRTWNKEA
ncbi:uncharacterized protein [Narcine bancroftii]|uniref:uncharacterized protein n=1 Tax=Narcine bancroftii TaxID=1343680 RepID=UPI00383132A6